MQGSDQNPQLKSVWKSIKFLQLRNLMIILILHKRQSDYFHSTQAFSLHRHILDSLTGLRLQIGMLKACNVTAGPSQRTSLVSPYHAHARQGSTSLGSLYPERNVLDHASSTSNLAWPYQHPAV